MLDLEAAGRARRELGVMLIGARGADDMATGKAGLLGPAGQLDQAHGTLLSARVCRPCFRTLHILSCRCHPLSHLQSPHCLIPHCLLPHCPCLRRCRRRLHLCCPLFLQSPYQLSRRLCLLRCRPVCRRRRPRCDLLCPARARSPPLGCTTNPPGRWRSTCPAPPTCNEPHEEQGQEHGLAAHAQPHAGRRMLRKQLLAPRLPRTRRCAGVRSGRPVAEGGNKGGSR